MNYSKFEEVQPGVYVLGNVLIQCALEDDSIDVVIPKNINRVAGDCFYGKINSLKFESEEDVVFEPNAFPNPIMGNDSFRGKELYFPQNTSNLFFHISDRQIQDLEKIVLPENVKYLDGNIIDLCSSFDNLSNTIEAYAFEETGQKSKDCVDELISRNVLTIVVEY